MQLNIILSHTKNLFKTKQSNPQTKKQSFLSSNKNDCPNNNPHKGGGRLPHIRARDDHPVLAHESFGTSRIFGFNPGACSRPPLPAYSVPVEGSSGLSAGRLGAVWCVGLALGVGVSQIASCLSGGLGVACFWLGWHFRVFDSGLSVSVSDGLSGVGVFHVHVWRESVSDRLLGALTTVLGLGAWGWARAAHQNGEGIRR